ncbi:MAG: hypothetical protein J0I06_07220 [Planctomycetes bacterium]|nr:hypothetical protein [Planctomycetota bacterium]
MSRKLIVAALFAFGCLGTMYAASADAADVEEAPAPRPVEEKKPEAKGKFGGFNKGGFPGRKKDE